MPGGSPSANAPWAAFYGSVHLDGVLGWVLGFVCLVGFLGAMAMTVVWFIHKWDERQERKEWVAGG